MGRFGISSRWLPCVGRLISICLVSQLLTGCYTVKEYERAEAEGIREDEETSVSELDLEKKIPRELTDIYKACDSDLERNLIKDAVETAASCMKDGQSLRLTNLVKDSDFPESGALLMSCYVSDKETIEKMKREETIHIAGCDIWIIANGDGTFTSSNNYPKQCFMDYLYDEGVKTEDLPKDFTNGTLFDQIRNEENSLLINYEDYANISECFDGFRRACRRMAEDERLLQVDYSQTVRFGEFDRGTDVMHYQQYLPEYSLCFSQMPEGGIEELEEQVKEEQLEYMKKFQPERYAVIQRGGYLSREDYRYPFHVPTGFYAVGWMNGEGRMMSGGIREAYTNSISERTEPYLNYRRALENSRKEQTGERSEQWPVYSFQSWEWRVWNAASANGTAHSWNAICNNFYSMGFPENYYYGCSNECADMIFINNKYQPPGGTWDMEFSEGRKWDPGRCYLFLFRGDSPFGDDPEAFYEYLASKSVQERIDPVLREEISWSIGNYQTDYHNFFYGEGETDARKAAVYAPVLKAGEGQGCHWIILFEEMKDSQQPDSLYKIRETMIRTFFLTPFRYQCKPGDTLKQIAVHYTGSEDDIEKLCENPLNRIKNPNQIQVGQEIEIPLHLLLKRKCY